MCRVIPSVARNLALRTVGKSIVEGRKVDTSCPLTIDSLARQSEIPRYARNDTLRGLVVEGRELTAEG